MNIITTGMAAFIVAGSCAADTWVVDPTSGDFDNIQAAIDASSNGDTIAINAGTYYEYSINTNGKAITVSGATNADGSPAVTIDAQQNGTVLKFWSGEDGSTVLENLTITGGAASWGGGMWVFSSSNPTINHYELHLYRESLHQRRRGGLPR